MAEAKPLQHLAHAALVKLDAEARCDYLAQIDAAPAHKTVGGDIGTAFHDLGKLGLLFLRQPARWSGSLAVDKSFAAKLIVAVHPITQRLAIHPARAGCLGARAALHYKCQRQQPASLIGIACLRSLPTQIRRPMLRAQYLNRHADPLRESHRKANHTPARHGIPRSQKQ